MPLESLRHNLNILKNNFAVSSSIFESWIKKQNVEKVK